MWPKNWNLLREGEENIVGKGENAGKGYGKGLIELTFIKKIAWIVMG